MCISTTVTATTTTTTTTTTHTPMAILTPLWIPLPLPHTPQQMMRKIIVLFVLLGTLIHHHPILQGK